MLRRLLVLTLVLGIGAAGFAGAMMIMLTMSFRQANAEPATCLATIGPLGDAHGSDGQQQAAQLAPQQRSIAHAIVSGGQARHLPPRAWQVALQAGMTESQLRNVSGGDRDSIGVFQMRPSQGWGSRQQLGSVEYQVTTFYDHLLRIPNWQNMRPGDAAQQVERSGFPLRYHRYEPMAAVLVGQLGGVADPGGCSASGGGQAPNERAGQAIQTALSKQGSPYVWGAKGPDQFDCSGLVYWAYQQAGITVAANSTGQYRSGAHVGLNELQPGDLVFWGYDPGDPESIHHVALYLGHGQVVQAPDVGKPVQVAPLHHSPLTQDSQLLPTAVRPGA